MFYPLNNLYFIFTQVATDKVAGKLSSTLSWVKNSVSHTVSQMASQVATPSSLHTTVASSTASLSSPSSASPTQLSPDDVELLAKLEEQNRYECFTEYHPDDLFPVFSVYQSTTLLTIFPFPKAFWEHRFVRTLQCLLGLFGLCSKYWYANVSSHTLCRNEYRYSCFCINSQHVQRLVDGT